jgi:hypothetical protein
VNKATMIRSKRSDDLAGKKKEKKKKNFKEKISKKNCFKKCCVK